MFLASTPQKRWYRCHLLWYNISSGVNAAWHRRHGVNAKGPEMCLTFGLSSSMCSTDLQFLPLVQVQIPWLGWGWRLRTGDEMRALHTGERVCSHRTCLLPVSLAICRNMSSPSFICRVRVVFLTPNMFIWLCDP